MEKNDTEDEKSDSVLKLIGHDGHIIEQDLGDVNVHMTVVSVNLYLTCIKSLCEITMLSKPIWLSEYKYVYCWVDQ